ncbi:restriction endonuclease subunit S [Acinetobacter baumannii]
MKAFEVLDGDFLISCSGVSLGRITQVPFGSERGIINQALLRVRLNNQLYNDDFFKLVFRSPSFQKDLFENSTGSAIPNLKGVKELKAMVIPLPSLNEQEKIVELVNHHFEAISGIDECVRSALDRVNSLTQSILAKAFRGELTAEWREANPELISGENSAEALLERIKAERTSVKSATKRGRAKT